MSGTADPWEPVRIGALAYSQSVTPGLERTPAPERVYIAGEADPNWKPRAVGFHAALPVEAEPLLWDGDGA